METVENESRISYVEGSMYAIFCVCGKEGRGVNMPEKLKDLGMHSASPAGQVYENA